MSVVSVCVNSRVMHLVLYHQRDITEDADRRPILWSYHWQGGQDHQEDTGRHRH